MDHRHAWVIGLLCVSGCSTGVKEAPSAPEPTAAERLRALPELGAVLHASSPFTVSANGFAVRPLFADGVNAQLEAGRLRLAAGSEPGAFVSIDGLGDGWSLEQGMLHRKSGDTETWILAGANQLEDVRVLASAQAAHSFEYRLTFGPAYSKVAVEDGRVVVSGSPGMVGLVASRAWARDARGIRRWLDVDVVAHEGGATLRYALAKEGLTYPVVVDPSWATSASLLTGRGNHGQARLADGRVLVVGGQTGTTVHSSAEILEVGKATASTSAMAAKRGWPIAITLPSGKVLVAGGTTTNSYADALSTAEIYDPAAPGSWSATTTPMAVARANARAVLLSSGKVLVAGGSNTSTGAGLTSAEIFDPSTGSWSTTGAMATARTAFAMGLLPSGKVVAAGGRPASGATASAETWDPTSSTWSGAGAMAVARFYPCSTVLKDGRLFVAGGYDETGTTYFSSTSVFDGTSWSAGPTMAVAREVCTATTLLDGTALIAGGFDGTARTATTSLLSAGAISAGVSMATARSEHGATLLLDGRVLVAGGLTTGNVGLTSVELYGADKALGSACSATGECASGHCVDGVCCDTACTGSCTACSAAKKGAGVDGTCGNIAAGTADSRCTTAAASTCGQNGTCNGAGACASYPAGTVCRAASCSGSTLTNEAKCAGGGVACPGVTTLVCSAGCSGGACIDAGVTDTGVDTGDAGTDSGDAGDAGDTGDTSDASDANDTGAVSSDVGSDTPVIETGPGPVTDSASSGDTGSPTTPADDAPGLCKCSNPGAGATGNGRLAILGLLGLLALQRRKR